MEGVVLKFSPLLTYEGDTLEAAVEMSTNLVRKLHPVKVLAPREVGPAELAVDVPEASETRLNQPIKNWPLGQTLIISAGIQPGILMDKGGFLNMKIPGTVPTGTELLVVDQPGNRQGQGEEVARPRALTRSGVSGPGEVSPGGLSEGIKAGAVGPRPFDVETRLMSSPDTGPAIALGPGRRLFPTIQSPYFALVVLFSMNLLNYVDRYVFFSSGPKISEELHFSDFQFGVLSVSFMIVYTIVSPLMGVLGDRYSRRKLLSFGVALWSVATVGTAFARGFYDMFFWRALLGIGEASYGIIAPALLSDLFPPKYRNRVMGLYFLALPVGGAIGSGIGGWFSTHTDWRQAFWVVGVPGLVASVAGLLMHDPGRGASEGRTTGKADRPDFADYMSIFKTPTFVFNTAGLAAVTFALGAYAVWAVTFYQRVRGMDGAQAGVTIGILTAIAGLLGIVLGTVAADFLLRFTSPAAYLIWPGLAVAIAVPCIVGTILDSDRRNSLIYLFAASIMMASVLGPSNTVTANVVPANRRAAGYALCIFLVHLFGDISSPLLMGKVSVWFGLPAVTDSAVGRWLESIGAGPTPSPTGPSNLTAAMLSVVPMLALGSLFFLRGSRNLPNDQEKAKASGGGEDLAEPMFH